MNRLQIKTTVILSLILTALIDLGFTIYNQTFNILEWSKESAIAPFLIVISIIMSFLASLIITDKDAWKN